MKMNSLKCYALSASLFLPLTCGLNCSAALLENGSFEAPVSTADWVTFGGASLVRKVTGINPQWSYDLSWSLSAPANVQGGGPASGAYQILTATPGERWTVSGYVLNSIHNELARGCYGLTTLEFLGPEGDDTPLQSFSTDRLAKITGPWRPFTVEGVAPEGTARLKITAMMWRGTFTATGGGLCFDAFTAEQFPIVPEPATAAAWFACGVIGLAIGFARRR